MREREGGRRPLLLAGGTALLCACGPPAPRERYEVEILGSRAALTRYTVQAESLEDGGEAVEEGRSVRRLFAEAPAGLLSRPALSVHSAREGQAVDTLPLQPFVCRSRGAQYERLRQEGWSFVERHQVLLTEEGRLRRDTDLERELSYTCEARPPSKRDSGEGWSTPLGSLGACTEPERAATRVTLESGGQSRSAHLCHATYLPLYGGVIHLGFSFEVPGEPLPLTVSLWHCLDPVTTVWPVKLTVGEGFPREDCPRRPGASGLKGGEPVSAPVMRGTWEVSRIDFTDGGHLVGQVDAVFAEPGGGGELRLRGLVDLPLLRIPVSGGGAP